VRYRQTLKTKDWREAEQKVKNLVKEAKEGKLAPAAQEFAKLAFHEAANRYLDGRKLELADASLKKERQLLVQTKRFFGRQCLHKLTTENLLAFREWRVKSRVGPAIINMEMGVIRRLLKKAKRWEFVGADVRPLKEPRSIGKALDHSEKVRLLSTAKTRPEWQNARLAAILAFNTTMRGCEIKNLRWRDADLLARIITVRKSKSDAGQRTIPINDIAFSTLRELRERAQLLGSVEPEHFVFPACEHGHIDPTKRMKSWRSAWRTMTKAAAISGFRFHDVRHHAITELAE
jgi:integrase